MGNYLPSQENKPLLDTNNINNNIISNDNDKKIIISEDENNKLNLNTTFKNNLISNSNIETNNTLELIQVIKNNNSILNLVSEKYSNIDSLKLEINKLKNELENIKKKNNNNFLNGFPIYNDNILDEMKHTYIQKKNQKFKSQIINEIKNKFISSITDALKKKDEEILDIKFKNNGLKTEIDNLNNQILTINNQLKLQISKETESLKNHIEIEKGSLKELIKSTIENLLNQINIKIENVKKQINSERENIKKSYDSKMIDINKQIEIDNLEIKNFKNKNKIEIENLQKKIKNEIENLNNKINSEIENKEKKYNSIFENLKKLYKENNIEIEKLSKKHEIEIEKLKSEIENLKKQNEIKNNELKNLNGKISENKKLIENAKEQIEIMKKNSRKQMVDFLNEFNDTFNQKYILNKNKKQHNLKLKLFSEKKYGIVGLDNVGNTCYMNSVLQILKNIPIFTYKISELINPEKFLLSFKELLINICKANINSFSPNEFKKNLGKENKIFAGSNQYDSTIFYVSLLNIINKNLNKDKDKYTKYKKLDMSKYDDKNFQEKFEIWKDNYLLKNQTFIFKIFYIFFVNEIECISCKYKTQTFQTLNFFDFPIVSEKKNVKNLEECFENYQMISSLKDECKTTIYYIRVTASINH